MAVTKCTLLVSIWLIFILSEVDVVYGGMFSNIYVHYFSTYNDKPLIHLYFKFFALQ